MEKMMNMDLLSSKLSHKKRSVKDLIRFITTKSGKVPNFALLLGAGCSITSGIRSAATVSKTWLKEIYENETGQSEKDVNKIQEYMKSNQSAWYNPNHEYSCLFEKRYDLPAQRRAFVEEEVAGKFPSIGYAYLIRLVEKYFFNTIFTTNFDDLINDAFHLFADGNLSEDKDKRDMMRPIVCAHDSSVKGISITSTRPKIIKLHGDFLFDDIKSTLRETESLEENIRNKFVEFCKEFGLIVVGYAGNDRSIMDVINYLLKSDDYLKNGLYWCIRKNDTISDELQKLLWKDRVYYVEFEGFDELFAEIYEYVNSEKYTLPLPQSLPNKNNIILERLVSNPYLQDSSSDIIKNIIDKLQNEKKKNSFFNNIKDVLFPDGKIEDFQGLSSNETFELFEIDRLRTTKRYDEALDKAKKDLSNPDYSFSFKQRLKHTIANILKYQNKIEEAIKYCNEIIEESKYNPEEYFFKNNFLLKYEDKILNLRKCIEKYPYYSEPYEKLVYYENQVLSNTFAFTEKETLLTQIQSDLDNGIKCNPTLGNNCYPEKFKYILSIRDSYSKTWYDEAEEICKIAENQNPDHPIVYDYKRQLIINCPKMTREQKNEELLKLWQKLQVKLDEHFDAYIEQCLLLLDEQIEDSDKINKIKKCIEQNEYRLNGRINYVRLFADFYVRKCGFVTKALLLWKNIAEDDYDLSILEELKYYYLLQNKNNEYIDLLYRVKDDFNSRGRLRIDLMLAETHHDYDKVLTILKELDLDKSYEYEFFTQEMYANLCLENFKEVYQRSIDMFNDITSINDRNFADLINYEIARNELKDHKVRKEKLENIISSNASLKYKVAANLLLGNNDDARKFVEQDIKYDYLKAYHYLNTYVFKKYLDENTKRKLDKKICDIQ